MWLARLVPIDLDPQAFPPDATALTLAGPIGVQLCATMPAASPIACFTSFRPGPRRRFGRSRPPSQPGRLLSMSKPRFVLTLSCLNRPGIVAAVTTCLFEAGADIREAQQFDDPETAKFFARIAFDLAGDIDALQADLAPIAERFAIAWNIQDHTVPRRVLLLVSKFDHCLADLLYRWRIGELPMTPVCHRFQPRPGKLPQPGFTGIAFHHLPISRETKMEQEAQIFALVRETQAELVVLARYMQVLSDALTAKLAGPLHQHPSLISAGLQGCQALPPGAWPRRQADRRHRALRHRPTSMKVRLSNRMSSASPMPTPRTIWFAKGATSSAGCWPAPCATTSRTG